jgi:hypothetical protein
MSPKIIGWACTICGAEYDTEEEALSCEQQEAPTPSAEVGDIVLARAGFGWYDGDRDWIENPDIALKGTPDAAQDHGNCFGSCCTYQFYYVVTAIDLAEPGMLVREDGTWLHRLRYHLRTKAMKTAYSQGYTFDECHCTPSVVEDPPEKVVEESKELIGLEADRLV